MGDFENNGFGFKPSMSSYQPTQNDGTHDSLEVSVVDDASVAVGSLRGAAVKFRHHFLQLGNQLLLFTQAFHAIQGYHGL